MGSRGHTGPDVVVGANRRIFCIAARFSCQGDRAAAEKIKMKRGAATTLYFYYNTNRTNQQAGLRNVSRIPHSKSFGGRRNPAAVGRFADCPPARAKGIFIVLACACLPGTMIERAAWRKKRPMPTAFFVTGPQGAPGREQARRRSAEHGPPYAFSTRAPGTSRWRRAGKFPPPR